MEQFQEMRTHENQSISKELLEWIRTGSLLSTNYYSLSRRKLWTLAFDYTIVANFKEWKDILYL